MPHDPLNPGDLERILSDVLDDKVTDAQFAELVEALRASEQLRERACRFLCNEALIVEEIGTSHQASELASLVSNQNASPPPHLDRPGRRSLGNRILDRVNNHGLMVAALACFIVIGLVTHNLIIMAKISRLHALVVQGASQGEVEVVAKGEAGDDEEADGEDAQASGGEQQFALGRVIGAREVAMDAEDPPLQIGDTLHEGQRIRLAAGVLELLLSTGAKLTIEGPVDLELPTILKMELDVGKVVAAVPRTARGYTIVTPTSELVDIGTQFGVSVADTGDTELHVFDGDVVARALAVDFSSDLIHAKENEALRFGSSASEPQRFHASDSNFVRRLAPTLSAEDLPSLPLTDKLSLWLSADAIMNHQNGDPVSVWHDVLVGDNQFANDARQLEPSRCPSYILDQHGRPAIQFNGWSSSLTVDPMEYSGRYTVCVVCTPAPVSFANDVHGGMLFKHGQSPGLELSVLRDRRFKGLLWPGHDQGDAPVLNSNETLAESQLSVGIYQCDSVQSRARMWLNGRLQGESDEAIELRQTALAYLGNHNDPAVNAYFCGSLYTVLVYDDYLNDGSIEQLNNHFKESYGLSDSP